jgi:carbamoyltransferase
MTVVGVTNGMRNGAAAVGLAGALAGVCSQERVTRTRGAGSNATGLPDQALDLLLSRQGLKRSDVSRWVMAGSPGGISPIAECELLDHHFAHACSAYLTSPFDSATIVISDRDAPGVSVWAGRSGSVTRLDVPWHGEGFAEVFSRLARAIGFQADAADQRFEALARLQPDGRQARVDALMTFEADHLVVNPGLEARVEEWLAGERSPEHPARAALAAALQARLGELFLEWLRRIRGKADAGQLCIGGSFFYHSSLNTLVKRAGVFDQVFVPVDPGDSGLAAGVALHALGGGPKAVSPFLGPSYTPEEIKEVLDNCKLQYTWETYDTAIAAAVEALRHGRLVGWFDGGMEWGPRALGARCILANPAAPYVLENLNRFLKHRESWRGYALSGLADAVVEHFEGPDRAPYMECDYRPRDRAVFRNALPSPDAAVRVHTVSNDAPARFTRLLDAVGAATGLPLVINTSFNGFHEPIVCSPRDAVRVFYGTGLDLLVIDQFVLRK